MKAYRRQRERGLAAVELALVFPTVLLLVGGSLVLARAYTSDLKLTRLTNEVTRVCSLGVGGLDVIEAQGRACIEARFRQDRLPGGCTDPEVEVQRVEEELPYVDDADGEPRISSVHSLLVTTSCRFNTVGTNGVFPVIVLNAQSRMLVD